MLTLVLEAAVMVMVAALLITGCDREKAPAPAAMGASAERYAGQNMTGSPTPQPTAQAVPSPTPEPYGFCTADYDRTTTKCTTVHWSSSGNELYRTVTFGGNREACLKPCRLGKA